MSVHSGRRRSFRPFPSGTAAGSAGAACRSACALWSVDGSVGVCAAALRRNRTRQVYGPQTAAILSSGHLPADFAKLIVNPLRVIAGVPYKSQRDNEHDPSSTCNVTALAMAMDYLGVSKSDPQAQLEDELYELIRSPSGLAFYKQTNPQLHEREFLPIGSTTTWCGPRNSTVCVRRFPAKELAADRAGNSGWTSSSFVDHADRERPHCSFGRSHSDGRFGLSTPTATLSVATKNRCLPDLSFALHRAARKEVHSDEKWALFLRALA